MKTLCVVSPSSLGVDGDRIQLSPKVIEGLVQYQQSWPGEVVYVTRPSASPQHTLGFDWPRLDDLPVEVVVSPAPGAVLHSLGDRAVALLPLEAENQALVSGARTVLVCDFPLRVRWEGVRSDPSAGLMATLRTGVGLARRSPTIRSMVREAAGLQCNGPDAFNTYGAMNRDALQYFDTRVTDAEVARGLERIETSGGDATLRLAFSGRWIPQKNPMAAVILAARLRAEGVDVSLTVFGGGPMQDELRARATPDTRVQGRVDFHSEWVPSIRDEVDLMVLPHPQSDSASTYLESISCGAPVVAYDNRYWKQFLELHDAGWAVPSNDMDSLVTTVLRLADEPEAIAAARNRGLKWATDHTFEREFDRRIAHLRGIAQV